MFYLFFLDFTLTGHPPITKVLQLQLNYAFCLSSKVQNMTVTLTTSTSRNQFH